MAKPPAPHPVLQTARLRLRQFRADDVDAMHECFSDADTMRFWNTPVHVRRIDSESRMACSADSSNTPCGDASTTRTCCTAPSSETYTLIFTYP